ncbi:MAG: response regulator [Chloroflexi bacterium]|nr:response regulator [Chloroflexota bacterium]
MKQPLALIVEDSYPLAEFYEQAIQEAGYATEIIEDGQAALERLQEVVPDIVLLDLKLPNVSGETILDRINGDERMAKTRTLIASANGTHTEQVSANADLALTKPISYEQLLQLTSRFHPSNQTQ